MVKLTICRICLVENVRMHVVADDHLQKTFEKLTNIPFITEDSRPMLACFFCYARLRQCHKFWQKCVEAEALFTQMLDEEYEQKPIQATLEFFDGFLKTSIIHINIEDRQQEDEEDKEDVEEELSGGCEITDFVEIKSEYHTDAAEQETKDDSHPGFEDNLHTKSESEDDIPLTGLKTGVEQINMKRRATKKEREARKKSAPVPKKRKLAIRKEKLEDTIPSKDRKNGQAKRKVIDTTKSSAPVGKKPKLVIRKENLEDTIPTKDMKHEQANSNFIDRAKSSKFESVSIIIEPIKSSSITKTVIKKRIINSENAAICTNLRNNINNYDLKSNSSNDIKKHGLNRGNLSKEKSHKCDVCQSSFTVKSNLKKHIILHNGEKPYKCEICQSSFSVKFNFKRHVMIHTGEKPYKCDKCQISFTEKASLKSHNRIHTRLHTGEKPYKCDKCQSSFHNKWNLKRHILIHTGEKLYKCDICQSSFYQDSDLKRHVLIHTGEKPYKCDTCRRSFSLKGALKRHIGVHTGEKT